MLKRFTAMVFATLMVSLVCAAPARAEEVWRLAGTFNAWNASDPGWAMTRQPDGRWELLKRLGVGSHAFKFVKDGSWDRGHFGGADAAGKLTIPGDDLHLRVRAEALYRVTLDPAKREWSSAIAEVDRPFLVVHTLGEPVAGATFELDVSESIWPKGLQPGWIISTNSPDGAKVEKIADSRYRVSPRNAGPLSINITLTAGDDKAQQSLSVNVLERATPLTGTVVRYKPEGAGEAVWTAHLTGDFCAWSMPGEAAPGETGPGHTAPIPMIWQPDGTFAAPFPFGDGAYAYRVVVNADHMVTDPAAPRTRAEDGKEASLLVVGKKPSDFPAAKPKDINADAIRHDPANLRDLRAVSEDLGLFDVSVCALPSDAKEAFIEFEADASVIGAAANHAGVVGSPGLRRVSVPMHRVSDPSGFDRWTARIMTGRKGATLKYHFAFSDDGAEFATRDFTSEPKPTFHLPAWAMGAVWYQIFPDRFRNGNPLNDPHGPGVTLIPWNSDWYAVSDEEAAAWKKRAGLKPTDPMPPHRGGPLYNVVWDRRYGGDLQGIAEKFGYLKDLGVTAVYMNPVFEAESMHKYDATDYRHIDDNFAHPASAGRVPEKWAHTPEPGDPAKWGWSAADRYFVDEFLPAAKKHDMKIVVDGVFNHTGRPFWAFEDIERNGINSPYKDWFFVEFDEAGKLKSWVSWFNTGALPKFRQQPNGDLVQPVKDHIFAVTRRWMDPNNDGNPADGVDGWRLDVALDVGLPFWRDWRKLVKSINPDAIIIAEIWDDASQHVRGDTFDTQMHYPFAKPVVDWLGVRPRMTTAQLDARLRAAFDDSPQTNLIHQNLFCSHDTDRYVSMLFNPGREYDGRNRIQDEDGQNYKQGRPTEDVYAISMLGVAFQATYLGSPMIYYGDEVGMYGADDPTDRKPFPWPDTGEPKNPTDRADWEMQKEYRRWFNLRNDAKIGPVLRFGSVRHHDTASDEAFAFTRELNGVRFVVVVNKGGTPFDASNILPKETSQPIVPPVSVRFWTLD